MGWLYALMKVFVAPKTAKKFHPMGNGANLALEFATDGRIPDCKMLPREYGGEDGSGDGKLGDLTGEVRRLRFE